MRTEQELLDLWHKAHQLGEEKDPDGLELLLECLAVFDPPGELTTKIRSVSAWSLGRLGFDVAGVAVALTAQSEDPRIRAAAADALGEMRDVRVLAPIEPLLSDASDEVVLWAALAASKLGDPSVPLLESMLECTQGVLPRSGFAVDALRKVSSPTAVEAVRRQLDRLPVQERSAVLTFVGIDYL